MNITLAEQTLREFAEHFPEVDGAVLVSNQGQPIIPSIGFEENTSLIVAGTFLQVANKIAIECGWQNTEEISLQAKEGYLTLLSCTEEAFILIKTNHILSGTLKLEIGRIVKTIAALLNPTQFSSSSATTKIITTIRTKVNPSTIQLRGNPQFMRSCKQELAELIGPIVNILCQRILKQNPELSAREFVEELAKKIPDPQQAREFKQRILSKYNLSHLDEVDQHLVLQQEAEEKSSPVRWFTSIKQQAKPKDRRQELNVTY